MPLADRLADMLEEEQIVAELNDEVEAEDDLEEDNDEIKQIIESEIRNAIGYDDDLVSRSRANAIDYYVNAPRGDEVTGRSQVQSSDVADAVEWTLPELVRLFSDPATCTFLPKGPQREREADEQTKAVRKIVYGGDGPTLLFYSWFKDALLQRNGMVKVSYETRTRIKTDIYHGLTEQEYQGLINTDNVIRADVADRQIQVPTPPEVAQQMLQQAQAMGLPAEVAQQQIPPFQEQTVYDALVVKQVKKGDICFDPIPPEEFLINSDHNSVLLDDARFLDHHRSLRRSTLVEMGYDPDVVAELPSYSDTDSEEEEAREQLEETWEDDTGNGDPSSEEVECHECYILVDLDGDGIAERRRVFMAGGKILENEYSDDQPICGLSPFVMPHRFFGTGLFDRLKEVQDIKTTLLRQWLDNMYLANNTRTEAVVGQVNIDDLLKSRPGGVVRVKAPGMLREVAVPQIGPHVLQALEYQDKVRGERSGVNPDQKTEGLDIAGDTAHGLERLMTAKEELQWMIGKLFAETGVRQMFMKVRDLMSVNRQDPMNIQDGDNWIQVDPRQWSGETDCSVKMGAGIGERTRKIAALTQLHGIQMTLMQNPSTSTLVQPQGVYGLLEDIQRLGDIDPEQSYFVDPVSQQGQQAAQQAQQQQQMMQQVQQQMQQMQMQLQQALAQAELQKSQAALAQAEVKRLQAELDAMDKTGKQALEAKKQALDETKHLDRLEFDYTKLELEQNTDVPGKGVEGNATQ